jgi:nucleoside-diphosphate-sugar epimerase
MPLRKFVYLSSLSVFGPVREEQPYTEILETDRPQPNTEYGKSKLEAEQWLEGMLQTDRNTPAGNGAAAGVPVVFLRPTGVYGPRERDYFMMAKSIKAHTDFAVGYKPQDITFVYVLDVVQAIFLALEKGAPGRKYFLSDGQVYRSSAFSDLIRRELGNPWWIRITAPLWLLRIITFCGEYVGRITGKVTALNNDKYHIMKQRNWRCDIGPARRELGFEPKFQLDEGVRLTIRWYKENGWL